jgi:hypothetical protein
MKVIEGLMCKICNRWQELSGPQEFQKLTVNFNTNQSAKFQMHKLQSP